MIHELVKLHDQIKSCRLCTDLPDVSYPLVQGSYLARIVLVSQAPSKGATLAGCLWRNSRSGDIFRKKWLCIPGEIFYDENLFYITSLGKCYPGRARGGDRTPDLICARTWLIRELELLHPQLIITIGKKAFNWFFPHEDYDRNLCGKTIPWNETAVFPLPHPSGANNAWKARNKDRLRVIIEKLRSQVWSILE